MSTPMPSRPLDPRLAWMALYVAVNAVCGCIIFFGNRLLGETADLRLDDRGLVLPATLVIVLTYVLLLGVVFPLLSRLPARPRLDPTPRQGRLAGITLFVLQLAFIAFFMATGTFRAGSTERSDSVLSQVWVIVSVDSLFFIYYGFYRESRLFLPNLAIAVVSNLLRGWTGVFILIAFMESARLMRSGRFSAKILASVAIAFVIGYPVLNLVKLQIRFMSSDLSQEASFVDLATSTAGQIAPSDYPDLLADSATALLARIHLVSNTIVIENDYSVLAGGIAHGEVQPFWQEGIYGIAYDRLAGAQPVPNLGVALAVAIDPSQEAGSWNSNPGYASWLILDPVEAPLYLAYTLGLIALCVAMVKRLGGGTTAMDMLWFACLSYMVPGWLASFVLFFNSLLLFYLFHLYTGRRRAARALPAPSPPEATPALALPGPEQDRP